MVSVSFSHFVLAIVFITQLNLWDCAAYSNRGVKNIADEAGDAIMVSDKKNMSTKKEIFIAVPAASEGGGGRLGGRKFMIDRRQLRKEVKRAEGISKVNEKASKNSGAGSVGNCNHTLKRELKMESKLSGRSVRHMKINPSGFMALNADYHMAKTHPPKNN